MLPVPKAVIKSINVMIFNFLWGGKNKVKRSTVINNVKNGGLNMLDVESFFAALKASWVTRLLKIQGKWKASFNYICEKLQLLPSYILNMSFKNTEHFKYISKFSEFWNEVLIKFNSCKTSVALTKLNKNEVLQLPIWGNEYFKNESCLLLTQWIKSGIKYVKDLVNKNGKLFSDVNLFTKIPNYPRKLWKGISIIITSFLF